MTLIKSISGIRGTIGGAQGDNLTPIDAVKYAAAYGMWVKQQRQKENYRIVVGRDARISGEMIQQLVMNTLVGMGIHVVDLGSAPGSWSQFVSRNFRNSKIVSIDLKEMEEIENIYQIKGDFTDELQQKKIIDYFGNKIDVVISDMAVNTTGNKNVDSIVTGELSIEALNFSTNTLKKQGSFVSKIFMGSSFNEIVKSAKKKFKEVHIFKPPASKKNSKESFIICKHLR